MRLVLVVACAATLACADRSGPAADHSPDPPTNGSGAGTSAAPPTIVTGHPRIALDKPTLKALAAAASNENSAWTRLHERCEIFMKEKGSGYLGLQWAEGVASLSLCWHATGQERYASMAIRYLTGLIDDRARLGDGLGGNEEVRRNSGYPIRAHGVWAAIGYDWLFHAPGMTDALKKRIAERLEAWLSWYGDGGYLHDNPYANYFWGYMNALAMAGLAFDGDDPRGAAWLSRATQLLDLKVIPGFTARLHGGGWAEGWQYGPLVAVSVAMIVRGFETARGVDYASRLPWISALVRSHLHRLHPDRETAYSNGKHSVKPSIPSTTPMHAVALALGSLEPEKAAQARFMIKKLLPRQREKYPWFALLASLTGDTQSDPIAGEPSSYHLGGPGLTFMRSSWDRNAVWASFQAGPRISMDHQHNDQGHFELWRGSDGLLVDGGAADTPASINHNTLLIDDAGRALNYPPNQGVWGRDSRTLGWSDDGNAVTIVGDLTDAWVPKCASRGCDRRAVVRAIRTAVFVRPDVLVIDDRLTVGDKSDLATFAVHVRAKPQLSTGRAAVQIGSSRADLMVLSPRRARVQAPKEPTSSESHIYRKNQPLGDVWRIEIPSPGGTTDRRFRVWAHAQSRNAAPAPVVQHPGDGIESVVGKGASVLFSADEKAGTARGVGDGVVVVVGLEPRASYAVTSKASGAGCAVTLSKSKTGRATGEAGSLSFALASCKIQ